MPSEKTKAAPPLEDAAEPEVGVLPAVQGQPATGIMASEMGSLFEQDAGRGGEDIAREDTSLAFLRILQSNSPECLDGDPRQVEGARPGMFFNTLTKELWEGRVRDGEGGVTAVMCYFRKVYNNWVPRDEGGGFRGSFPTREEAERAADEEGARREETHETVDTGEHYLLVLGASGDFAPVLFPVTSTKHKPSRDWNGRLKMLVLPGRRGPFNPPTYASMWQLTSVATKNEKGSFYIFEAEQVGWVTSKGLYGLAEQFYHAVSGGDPKYRADYSKEAPEREVPADGRDFDGDDRY